MNQFEIQFDRNLVDATIQTRKLDDLRKQIQSPKSSAAEPNNGNRASSIGKLVDERQNNLDAARKTTQAGFEMAKSQELLNETTNLIARRMAELQSARLALRDAILDRSNRFVRKIAEVVFQHCPEMATGRLQGYIKLGLQEIESESDIKIFVHPSMLEPTRNQMATLTDTTNINVLEDRQLLPGDCRIEQENEGLYASLHSQLEKIEASILSTAIEDNH